MDAWSIVVCAALAALAVWKLLTHVPMKSEREEERDLRIYYAYKDAADARGEPCPRAEWPVGHPFRDRKPPRSLGQRWLGRSN